MIEKHEQNDYAARWARDRPHIPMPIIDASTSSMCLSQIVNRRHWAVKPGDPLYQDTSRLVGGFVIPDFQRPVVWDEDRQRAFVESAWLGLHLGTIVWNDAGDAMEGDRMHRHDRILLDGLQRLTALCAYADGAFAVFRETAHEHRWTDLNVMETRRFGQIQIGYSMLRSIDEALLRRAYDLLNFGGIAHRADQKAS